MSSKTQTTATKEEATPTLVPKLRFPEFREMHGWKIEAVGDLIAESRTPSLLNDPSKRITVRLHLQGVEHREHRGTESTESTNINFSRKAGQFIYGKQNIHKGAFGIIPDQLDGFETSQDLPCFDFKRRCCPQWFYFNFASEAVYGPLELKMTGTGSKRLNEKTFLSLPIAVPCPAEQQKIAECLSSVDELVAAQARKVDALKTHKKGLMQQLFPLEGETQPRLRFPEFQNTGEWEEVPFSNLCEIKHGYPFESEFFGNEGEYVLLTPGSFYEEGGYRDRGDKQKYYSGEIPRDYVLVEGDMLVAMTEQAAGLLGSPLIVRESDKFLHNQRLGLVLRKTGVAWTNEFFFHVFNSQRVRKTIHNTASGAKVRHTSPTKIGEILVSVPPTLPEQQRIATCLSSLDALITAETQKHEALKTHKKGLMQQLFPTPEEVEA
jgi:type I restriction enzyme S subunit